jgi:hypothetical protein
MQSVVSEESHHKKRASQATREDGNPVGKAENPKGVMTWRCACLAPSPTPTPTADPQRLVRFVGEATPAGLTALETHDETRILEGLVVAVVAEVPCPGFEIVWEARIGGMTRPSNLEPLVS